jgi:hypothetical protein
MDASADAWARPRRGEHFDLVNEAARQLQDLISHNGRLLPASRTTVIERGM